MLKIYKSRYDKIRGSSAREVFFEADKVLDQYKKKRRQSFVKSKYFGAKVFLTLYKTHLRQKPLKVQVERSRFLPCAIDLIKNSKVEPALMSKIYQVAMRENDQKEKARPFVVL